MQFYSICAFLSLINLIIYLVRLGSKYNTYYLIGYILSLLSNLGFYYSSVAHNTSEYILAIKILYLAGAFYPMLLLFIIAETCTIEIPKPVKLTLCSINIGIYCSILSIGHLPLYYKSCELLIVDGVQQITKTYGIFHTIFFLNLTLYLLTVFLFLIYSLINKKTVSPILLVTFSAGVIACGIAYFLLHFAFQIKVDFLPVIYIISGFMLFILEQQVTISNVKNDLARASLSNSEFGYIVFDKNLRFQGINDIALNYFPDFKSAVGNRELDTSNPLFVELIKKIQSSSEKEFGRSFKYGTNFYKLHIVRKFNGKRFVGWIIEIIDNTEQQQYTELLQNFNKLLKEAIDEKTENIKLMQQRIILGMADVIENRDNNTGGHVKRTSDTIAILIQSFKKKYKDKYSEQFYEDIINSAPLHDLGKIAVNDSILRKPGKFTPEEYAIMKIHPGKSAQIIDTIFKNVVEEHFYIVARNLAHFHHEKWSGEGYPNGLAGEEIPIEARLMAIVDVYDALISKRCYKNAMTQKAAHRIILDSMGTHFDPNLKDVFEDAYPKLVAYYKQIDDLKE